MKKNNISISSHPYGVNTVTSVTGRFLIALLVLFLLYHTISYLTTNNDTRALNNDPSTMVDTSSLAARCESALISNYFQQMRSETIDVMAQKVHKPIEFHILPTTYEEYVNIVLSVTNDNFLDVAKLISSIHANSTLPFRIILYGISLDVQLEQQVELWYNVTYVPFSLTEFILTSELSDDFLQRRKAEINKAVMHQSRIDFPVLFVNFEPTVESVLKSIPYLAPGYIEIGNKISPSLTREEQLLALPIREKKFAVVVTLRYQDSIYRLLDTLTTWSKFPMCTDRYPTVSTDLIFMISKDPSQEYEARILKAIRDSYPCLDTIFFTYPSDDNEDSLRTIAGYPYMYLTYRFMFVANLKVEPIRENWLQRLIDVSFDDPSPFWLKGSNDRSSESNQAENVLFISHSGIHSLSYNYRSFLSKMFEAAMQGKGLDHFIFRRLLKNNELKDVIHFMRYDDYIQNLSNSNYNIAQLRVLHPSTYLIIGK